MGDLADVLRERFPVGVRYMAGAALLFSLMSLLVKVVGQRVPTMEVVFSRSVITLVITGGLVRSKGLDMWGAPSSRGLLVARGVLGFSAVACFFYALSHLPLAEATVIQYTNPVFTALIAALVLGERLRMVEAAGVALSLVGVVLVARPGFLFGLTSALDPVAVGVAVAGAVLSASAYVTVRRLGRSEHPLVIVFYFALISTLGSAFFLPGAPAPRGWEWPVLLGVGLAAQGGQVFMTLGLKEERAGRAMSVGYVQIVFAAVWGVIFFGEFPGPWGLAGTGLVLLGTFIVGRRRSEAS